MPIRTPPGVGGAGGPRITVRTGPIRTPVGPPAGTTSHGPGGILGAIESFTGKPGDIMHTLHIMGSPLGYILGHHASNPKLRAAGHVLGAVGSSPADVIAHPGASATNLKGMVVGLAESPTMLAASIKKVGLYKTMSLLYHSTVNDYKTRYGANWEQHARQTPLFNLADALMVIGPALKGATIASAAKELGSVQGVSKEALAARGPLIKYGRSTEWSKLSPVEKLRVARAESARPGTMTEGLARTRDLNLKIAKGDPIYPEGKIISSSQALARGPLRRGIQTSLDSLAQQLPDMPMLGARSRILRANAAQLPRTMDRFLGSIVGADALGKLNQVERTRLWAEAQLVSHVVDPATGLVVHDHAAVTAKIKDLRNALAAEFENRSPHNMDEPQLHDWILGAKQHGFGKGLLKRLDAAAAYTPKAGGNYERAIQPLIQATNVAEHTIKDTSGFSTLGVQQTHLWNQLQQMSDGAGHILPEHADAAQQVATQLDEVTAALQAKGPQLDSMLNNRRNLLSDWVKVNTPVNAPERAQWEKAMTGLGWEKPQIRDALRTSDMMARSARPENPASFYAEKIGSPAGMTPQQVAVRANALYQDFPTHGMTNLVEGPVHDPSGSSQFYSGLQKAVTKEWGKKPLRSADQVKASLKKQVSADEWANTGLDNFFDAHAGEQITQEQLMVHLATPLNAYNLREIHRVNANLGDPLAWAQFDQPHPMHGGDAPLVSRNPAEGEYHEITFELPATPEGQAPYLGAGMDHWERPNVVAHVRFHVYEENGVKKMLIEEVQSDWGNDWRKQEGLRAPVEARIASLKDELATMKAANGGQGAMHVPIENDLMHAQQELSRLDVSKPPLNERKAINLGVNRALLHAALNDVQEVAVVDSSTQLARNVRGAPQGMSWLDHVPGASNAELKALAESVPTTPYHTLYDKLIPKKIAQMLGEGTKTDAAYQGSYRAQGALEGSAHGDMPGTVFKMTPEGKAAALKPRALYQVQPDFSKVPRGANELLVGKGNRLIHLFQTADMSTWIHELSHSAVYDLADADKAILNAHYGGGKEVTSWDVAAHENYARDFEHYVRTSDLSFLPRPVAEVFQRIQAWMQRAYREVKNANPDKAIPQEVQDVFGRMLWRDQGDTPDIFIPHRAGAPELTGARTSRGVPRAARDIGDYTPSRIPLFAKNNLGLLRSGLIHDDPKLLIEHVNRLVSLQKANQLREWLLHHASPLLPGDTPNLETQYVVKRAGSSVDKPFYDALESAHNPSEIRQSIKNYLDENISDNPQVVESWKGQGQLYTIDKKTVDMMFKYVTGKVPGAATRPITTGGQVADATLNALRGLLLYANPGFYVANFIGNLGMQMFNDPRSLRYLGPSLRQAMSFAHHGKVDPLFERINIEMGRGPTSGGLSPEKTGLLSPELGSPRGPVIGRGAAAVTKGLHAVGHTAGALVDDAFRVSAWRQEAAKLGYHSDAEVTKLLDQAIKDSRGGGYMSADTKALRDLNSIRDKAEQLMLDFNSMTPFERTWLQRIVFLYPFLKASAKYPFMYAGEHPFTFGAAAQTSNIGEQATNQVLGARPGLPLWASGYARTPWGMINVGSIDQMSVLAGMIDSARRIGQKAPVGINTPWEYLPPGIQVLSEMLRGQNRYGRDSSVGPILRTDFPVPAWMSALYRKPSGLYTGQGELDALARSLRLVPFGVNPAYGTQNSTGGLHW